MSHNIKFKIETNITITLTEGEARALDAICGYGPKLFLEWFHKTHGKHYIANYEVHLESLFTKARNLGTAFREMEKAKAELLKHITNAHPAAPVLNPTFWRRWYVKLTKR